MNRTRTGWSHVVATVEAGSPAGRVAVGAYRTGLLLMTYGVGYPSRARLDALYRAAGERTQSPAVRISRAGWAPRRWSRLVRLTTVVAAGGPPWTLAALILAYSIGATR